METNISKKALWTARITKTIAVLFLALDSSMKLLMTAPAVEGTVQLGYPVATLQGIGIALLVCLILYVIPRTSILGAIVLTGYLGGAVASQVRVEAPLFSHVLFPIYFAALAWAPLFLRDPRVRAIFAVGSRAGASPANHALDQRAASNA